MVVTKAAQSAALHTDLMARVTNLGQREFSQFEAFVKKGESIRQATDRIVGDYDAALGAATTTLDAMEKRIVATKGIISGLSAGPLGAIDGARIIDMSDADRTIDLLRRSCSEWNAGFMGAEATRIEKLLRTRPVNVDVAPLLGQPIVTAKIPTLEPGASHDLHLLPTGVVGPPGGFDSFDTAKFAAARFVAENNRHTAVIVSRNRTQYHVLSVNYSTADRMATNRPSGAFAAEILEPEKISFTANDNRVKAIVNSNGQTVIPNAQGSWPSHYAKPLSYSKLYDEGLALLPGNGSNPLANARTALQQLEHMHTDLTTRTQRAQKAQQAFSVYKRFLDDIDQVIDAPGKGDPTKWKHEVNLHKIGGPIHFGDVSKSFWVAEKNKSVAQLVAEACRNKSANATIIMQDSRGIPYFREIPKTKGSTSSHGTGELRWDSQRNKHVSGDELRHSYQSVYWKTAHHHPDLRAVVDNRNRMLILFRKDGNITVSSSDPVLDDALREWFFELEKQPIYDAAELAAMGDSTAASIASRRQFFPWQSRSDTPVQLLETSNNASAAMQEAMRQAALHTIPSGTHELVSGVPVVVQLPQQIINQSKRRWGAVRVAPDFQLPQHAPLNPVVRAALEDVPRGSMHRFDELLQLPILDPTKTPSPTTGLLRSLHGKQVLPGKIFSLADHTIWHKTGQPTNESLKAVVRRLRRQGYDNVAVAITPKPESAASQGNHSILEYSYSFKGTANGQKVEVSYTRSPEPRGKKAPKQTYEFFHSFTGNTADDVALGLGEARDYPEEIKAIIWQGKVRYLDHEANKMRRH